MSLCPCLVSSRGPVSSFTVYSVQCECPVCTGVSVRCTYSVALFSGNVALSAFVMTVCAEKSIAPYA